MGKRNKVTTRDIAQATNVSQSTVSMILSENKNVSFKEETVNLVKKTAKQMGYKKPEVKKRYSNAKNTIVVICSNLSNSYYSMVVSSIIEQASKTKTQIFTISTLRKDDLEKHALSNLKLLKPCVDSKRYLYVIYACFLSSSVKSLALTLKTFTIRLAYNS